MNKARWSDDQVLEWAKVYIESKMSLDKMEKILSIPHSTLWWCFINRLPGIDYKLFRVVNAKLIGRGRSRH